MENNLTFTKDFFEKVMREVNEAGLEGNKLDSVLFNETGLQSFTCSRIPFRELSRKYLECDEKGRRKWPR